MNANELLNEAHSLKERIIQYRRYLHQNPETGFQLDNTKKYVKQELIKMGYEPIECGKAGLYALAGKKEGKTFLIRGDMDALPLKEETDLSFKSENNNMHACGHDMHTSMLLGAAQLLKNHEDEIAGTVKFMFQPAEEIFEGSQDMIENGILDNPKVDAAQMIHVASAVPLSAGTVIVCSPGITAPGADLFEIVVQGKGCHGSMPHLGKDPINVASHIIINLQEIIAREVAMADSVALTIGSIHGGSAANIIPDGVTISGSLRTYDEEIRAKIKQRITDICDYTAKTFQSTATVTYTSGCPAFDNDKDLSQAITEYTKELLGDKALSMNDLGGASKSAGSEDFAYISQKVPTIMLSLAAGETAKGYTYPLHHPSVRFDEAALPIGSAIHAYNAMRWLEENK